MLRINIVITTLSYFILFSGAVGCKQKIDIHTPPQSPYNQISYDVSQIFPGPSVIYSLKNIPNASEICSGFSYIGIDGQAVCAGTAPNRTYVNNATPENPVIPYGSISIDLGSDFVTGNFCSPLTGPSPIPTSHIFQLQGSAICQNALGVSASILPGQVIAGQQYWDSTGTLQTGTLANLGFYNLDTNALPTGACMLTGIGTTLTLGDICSNGSLYGQSGIAPCQITSTLTLCDASQTNCIYPLPTPLPSTTLQVTSASGFSYNQIIVHLKNFSAKQICQGKSIFGLAGTAVCISSSQVRNSTAFKTISPPNSSSYPAISNISETYDFFANSPAPSPLPSGYYRFIPDATVDDEGFNTLDSNPACAPDCSSINYIQRVIHITLINCGTTQNTIAGRIADCAFKNTTNATWDGTRNGNGGQAIWKLVTRSATYKEVWQDTRTGLLWSTGTASTDNPWCTASGTLENNPSRLLNCSNSTYQPGPLSSPTPSPTPTAVSYCVEQTGFSSGFPGEIFFTGPYAPEKGGMGYIASSTRPGVQWRLPSIYDWQQAEIDGIRFVMPDMGSSTNSGSDPQIQWSTTLQALPTPIPAPIPSPTSLVFVGTTGAVTTQAITVTVPTATNTYIRCVGR